MNSTIASMLLTQRILKSPELMGILGIIAVLFFGFLGFRSWQELQTFSSQPELMTLSQASPKISDNQLWVVLGDVKWDCQHVFYRKIDRSIHTYIIFTNSDETIWGIAMFSKETTCDEVAKEKASGVLEEINKQQRKFLGENNFDINQYGSESFLQLCTYCGRENSRLGVILSVIMVLGGIFLQALSLRSIKARKRANHFMTRNIIRS